jgi:hypothetical protein
MKGKSPIGMGIVRAWMGNLHSEWDFSMRELEISIHGNLNSSKPWPPQAWLEWTVL